jgi:HAD superfamily phosphatase (TIGR01668 family)
MSLLTPDIYLEHVRCIDAAGLRSAGVKALILDADNTLLPRTTDVPAPEMCTWVRGLLDEGFRLTIVSNNWHDRVVNLADMLGIPLVGKAMKPLVHGFLIACKRMDVPSHEVLVVGDQLFTDVLGAHLAGLRVALVPPLAEKDLPHTLFMRRFERPFTKGLVVVACLDLAPLDPRQDGGARP